ncbi:MAG: 2'-5' RNA ligase family protein, partial [Salibaculum sp.]|uniref:2'-5' RNA ligase family protein n=1 Tax=Salibaculum sp. TaxID=2855480 RepID=UPI0028701877
MHEALVEVQADLPGRPVPEETLHLTLAFLGDVTPQELDELHLELTGRILPGCDLAVTGLAGFGGRTPRLITAEVASSAALSALHRAVMGAGARRWAGPAARAVSSACDADPPAPTPRSGGTAQAGRGADRAGGPAPAARARRGSGAVPVAADPKWR